MFEDACFQARLAVRYGYHGTKGSENLLDWQRTADGMVCFGSFGGMSVSHSRYLLDQLWLDREKFLSICCAELKEGPDVPTCPHLGTGW
jgi:hypothetical protein